jgi:hypothetical protein
LASSAILSITAGSVFVSSSLTFEGADPRTSIKVAEFSALLSSNGRQMLENDPFLRQFAPILIVGQDVMAMFAPNPPPPRPPRNGVAPSFEDL